MAMRVTKEYIEMRNQVPDIEEEHNPNAFTAWDGLKMLSAISIAGGEVGHEEYVGLERKIYHLFPAHTFKNYLKRGIQVEKGTEMKFKLTKLVAYDPKYKSPYHKNIPYRRRMNFGEIELDSQPKIQSKLIINGREYVVMSTGLRRTTDDLEINEIQVMEN